MNLRDIRDEHERLESIKSTQSVKMATEKATEAHKHRGLLLAEVDRMQALIKTQDALIAKLQKEVNDFWGKTYEKRDRLTREANSPDASRV